MPNELRGIVFVWFIRGYQSRRYGAEVRDTVARDGSSPDRHYCDQRRRN